MNYAQISFLCDILIIRHIIFIPITSSSLNHHQPHRFTITKKAEIKFRLHSRCSCFEKIGSRLTNDRRRYINKFDCLNDVVSETDRFFLHDESCNENVYVLLTISPAVCDLRWIEISSLPLGMSGCDAHTDFSGEGQRREGPFERISLEVWY